MSNYELERFAKRILKPVIKTVDGMARVQQAARTIIGGESIEDRLARAAETDEQVSVIGNDVDRLNESDKLMLDGALTPAVSAENATEIDRAMMLDDHRAVMAGLEDRLTDARAELESAVIELDERLREAAAAREAVEAELDAEKSRVDEAFGTAHEANENAESAAERADTALTIAGTKSKIFYSKFNASGTASENDLWRTIDDAGNVLREWRYTATGEWVESLITTTAISNLDVGKLTAGTAEISDVVAQKIAVRSGRFIELGVDQLVVTGSASLKQAVVEKIFAEAVVAKTLTATEKFITKDVIATGAVEAEALATNALNFKTATGMNLTAATIKGGVVEQFGASFSESRQHSLTPETRFMWSRHTAPAASGFRAISGFPGVPPWVDSTEVFAIFGNLASGTRDAGARFYVPAQYGRYATITLAFPVWSNAATSVGIRLAGDTANPPFVALAAQTWTTITRTFSIRQIGQPIAFVKSGASTEGIVIGGPVVTVGAVGQQVARLATIDGLSKLQLAGRNALGAEEAQIAEFSGAVLSIGQVGGSTQQMILDNSSLRFLDQSAEGRDKTIRADTRLILSSPQLEFDGPVSFPNDTDWANATLPAGITGTARWRRVAGVIWVEYNLNFASLADQGFLQPLFTLPDEARPSVNQDLGAYGSGTSLAIGAMSSGNGQATVRNYRGQAVTNFSGGGRWLSK